MKAYGKKRTYNFDEINEAPKSSNFNIEGIGGDIRSPFKNSRKKRKLRKTIKTYERRNNKIIEEDLGWGDDRDDWLLPWEQN